MKKHSRILIFIPLLFLAFSCRNSEMTSTSSFPHPKWSKTSVIYEVNIRQYTPSGTINDFAQHLPRLQKMGVDILWLMPVTPIGEKKRKGGLGSYYSVKDYMMVNPEFGTMDDFKNLVQKAHALNMKVIVDWVANHTAWDNPLITQHPEFYKKDSTGKIISPYDWTDVAQLDYSVAGLHEYMKNAMLFWIRETDIDGFRCDVAGMVPMEFWNRNIPELRKQKEIFMLAEAESPEMHDTAFDMTYSWDLFHTLKGIYKSEKQVSMLDSIFQKEAQKYDRDDYRMRFTSNHDENSWAGTEYELFGDAARTFSALTFMVPGMPLIYSGQEAGLSKRLRFFEKDTISFDNLPYEQFYTELIRLKKEHPALHNGAEGGTFEKVKTDQPAKIYAFLRKKDKSEVVCFFNLTGEKVTFNPDQENFGGDWIQYGAPAIMAEEKSLVLPPWGYYIFVKKTASR